MKGRLGVIIMTECVPLGPKTYSYLMADGSDDKKTKGTKYAIKRIIKFNDYKNCFLNNKTILKPQKRFKSAAQNVYTIEINKITLNNNDDKYYKLLVKLYVISI